MNTKRIRLDDGLLFPVQHYSESEVPETAWDLKTNDVHLQQVILYLFNTHSVKTEIYINHSGFKLLPGNQNRKQ